MSEEKKTFRNYFTTQVRNNIQTISQATSGYGFKMLKTGNQQDINIVQPKDASNTLKQMINNILNLVKDNELRQQLENFYVEFVESYVDTRSRAIFQTRNDNTHVMSIVKIQFWKKAEACLLTYKVTNFEYKCAPQVIKVSSTSERHRSTQILVFGSSSYSWSNSERFVEMDRGVQEDDIRLLLQLSSLGSEKIDRQIEQFALA